MKLYLFTIGKAKTKGYDELCADYEKRIKAKISFEAKVFATEKALLKALNDGWEVILLDERGVLPKSSGALERLIEKKML